jgi:hypothetical protein
MTYGVGQKILRTTKPLLEEETAAVDGASGGTKDGKVTQEEVNQYSMHDPEDGGSSDPAKVNGVFAGDPKSPEAEADFRAKVERYLIANYGNIQGVELVTVISTAIQWIENNRDGNFTVANFKQWKDDPNVADYLGKMNAPYRVNDDTDPYSDEAKAKAEFVANVKQYLKDNYANIQGTELTRVIEMAIEWIENNKDGKFTPQTFREWKSEPDVARLLGEMNDPELVDGY